MKKTALFTFAILFAASQAAFGMTMQDITRPGDDIVLVNGFNQNDGAAGPPPGAEGVENAINDIGQKYLNFLDISSGLAVTPSANPDNLPVIGVRFYTANDAEERDPASFQLSGSNDGLDGPWTYIASGNLALPSDRNAGGDAVMIPPVGNMDAFHQTVEFANDLSFAHYQVIFPTLKDAAAANSMQVAEVELLAAIPEPATGVMLFAGCLGLAAARRRRS